MSANVLLEASHCEFQFVECWIFLFPIHFTLFWETVKLHVNGFILSGIVLYDLFVRTRSVFSFRLIISQY